MNDNYFLDTNIIIYSLDEENPEKQSVANKLIVEGISNRNAFISYQVVQEFINVATRKFRVPLTIPDARLYVNKVLMPLWEVYPGMELIHSALDISGRWHYSFYDSLIIAAALEVPCRKLYSEDLQHGQTIHSLKIVNPFLD